MKRKLLKTFLKPKTFIWSRPWGFEPSHELVLSAASESALSEMSPLIRGRQLKALEAGYVPGAYCHRCGMTALDLRTYAGAVCLANPGIVKARHAALHADVPRRLSDFVKQK